MNPYLSVVLTGRNDNYGGDFLKRLQDFFDWNCALFESNKVDTEIIFVNWNPLENENSIEKLIQFPRKRHFVQIRIITIPAEIHEKFVNPNIRQTVPIFEFIAKNVGVRRAKGEFILSLNADVLIHPNIIKYISEGKLSKNTYYRSNRYDFLEIQKIENINHLYDSGIYVSMIGYNYRLNQNINKKFQYLLFSFINEFRVKWQQFKFKNRDLFLSPFKSLIYDNAEFFAHCNASGDFMLIHRENWIKLKSYPENTFVSTHTDALFTIFAHSKLNEFVFNDPVFHQEHERRYSETLMNFDLEIRKAYFKFQKISQDILANSDLEKYLNDESWGLNKITLPETII